MLALDECQALFENPEVGNETEALVTDLDKRGPAVGISVLGTSSYKAGVSATMFGRKDVGVAYLAGEGDDR